MRISAFAFFKRRKHDTYLQRNPGVTKPNGSKMSCCVVICSELYVVCSLRRLHVLECIIYERDLCYTQNSSGRNNVFNLLVLECLVNLN